MEVRENVYHGIILQVSHISGLSSSYFFCIFTKIFAEKSSINVLAYELKQILQLTNLNFKAHPLCGTGIELRNEAGSTLKYI